MHADFPPLHVTSTSARSLARRGLRSTLRHAFTVVPGPPLLHPASWSRTRLVGVPVCLRTPQLASLARTAGSAFLQHVSAVRIALHPSPDL